VPVKRKDSRSIVVARTCLAKAVERAHLSASGRMPPLRLLASEAGVSLSTMFRAAHELRDDGHLLVVGRGGMVVCGGERTATSIHDPAPRFAQPIRTSPTAAELVRRRLSEELFDGSIRPGGQLPACKELSQRYGVSAATMRKALGALVDEGRLVRSGKQYALKVVPTAPNRTVLLVAPTDWVDTLPYTVPGGPPFWVALEHACRSLSIRLSVYGYFVAVPAAYKGQYRTAFEAHLKTLGRSLLGCIVLGQGARGAYVHPILQTALQCSLPTLLIDQSGHGLPSRISQLPRAGYLRWVDVAGGERSGREMANALMSLGHRNVALFSFPNSLEWSRARSEGFTRAFDDAGFGDRLHEYVLPPGGDSVEEALTQPTRSSVLAALNAAAGTITALGPSWYRADEGLAGRMMSSVNRRALALSLEPLFTQAQARPECTAWVGLNDAVALIALQFLSSKRVAVPQRISVAGFDNTPEGFCAGLTSYDFASTALADYAVRFLTHGVYTDNPSVVVERLGGRVVMRGTVKTTR
jgi:DNA-binding transcriptional regulator YhcF (GntR family)